MRIGESLRNTIVTGVAVAVLSGCTAESAPEIHTPPKANASSTTPENHLDPRAQLEQTARYAASIIGCLMQSKKAGMQLVQPDFLTNYSFVAGPDHTLNSPDDGPQSVLLEARMGNSDVVPLYVSGSSKSDPTWVSVTGLSAQAKTLWEREGHVSLPLVALGTTTMEPTSMLIRRDSFDTTVRVDLSQGVPLIYNFEAGKAPQPATTKLAAEVSNDVLAAVEQLRRQSNIRTCDLG